MDITNIIQKKSNDEINVIIDKIKANVTIEEPPPLHLVLHKKWFDMIKNGDKHEEYRALTPYWTKRLKKYILYGKPFQIIFSNGYTKDESKRITVTCYRISIGNGYHQWGSNKDELYFILNLLPF